MTLTQSRHDMTLKQQLAQNVKKLRKEGRSEQYIVRYIYGWHLPDREIKLYRKGVKQ